MGFMIGLVLGLAFGWVAKRYEVVRQLRGWADSVGASEAAHALRNAADEIARY